MATKARRGNIGVYITGLGSVTPIYTVTLKSRVDGQLMKVAYKEGDIVHEGDLLVQIDERPYAVQLEQAEGQMVRDQANLENARVDLDRYQKLLAQNAIPEQQLATQKALVTQDEGIVKSDQGQIDSAKLNLTYCKITAPITGKVGLRLVDPGNIVHATDSTGLLVITQLQPISVIFTIAEDQLPAVAPRFNAGQKLEVEAWDRAGQHRIATGTLSTLDNQIDQTTGTLRLRAAFPNTDNALFPNQFVNTRMLVQEKRGVVLVSTAVLQRSTNGTYVYLVKPDSTVTVRNVTLGTTEGDDSEITSGLEPGDTVVETGVDKLNEGTRCSGELFRRAANRRALRRGGGCNGGGQEGGGQAAVSPSRTFILRPVATSLLMIGLLLAGAVAYKQLPVSALPEVDYPTIQVTTFYPGASPDVMASSVTAPLERQFGQLPGLQQMTSTSSDGSSVITMQFTLSLLIDVAEQEVQQAINASGTYLPSDLPIPPVYAKINPADTPVLTLALSSNELPLTKVEDLADTRLAPKISQLAGVGLVSISGGQKPAVRIQANPTVLASYGLNLEDLRSAIVAANVNQAKGNFDAQHQAYQIGANDQLLSSADYAPLLIAYRNGAPVQMTDVAIVTDDAENIRQAAWMNQTPAVIMNIQRQPGANIISAVDRIKALLPQLTATLPKAVQVTILTDRTNTIRASVQDVQFELMLTVGLVVMVIFLFLRNLSATIIPSIACPLSLVGTFGVMYLLGYSLNNLTLMALTISTGFVVDDAIVMIENITRYIEEGEPALQAALKGSEQIGFTIMSLTVSLIAVLIPLLFMGDIVGRLFREFAVTLSVTILVSAVVSLTLTPMMCAKLLKHKPEQSQGRFYRASERGFQAIIDLYATTLRFVLRFRTATLLVAVATFAVTAILFIKIPKGFFPIQDTGVIQGVSEAAQTVSFPEMSRLQQSLTAVIQKDPAVESLSSFIGIDGTNTTLNSGRILINLKPLEERKMSATDVIRRLQPELAQVAGITLFMQPVQDISVDDRVSRTQFQYTLEDPSADELDAYAPRMLALLKSSPNCGMLPATSRCRACGQAGFRPRHGRAPGDHDLHDRPDAVRCLRPAGNLHHVHAVESVPRGAGGEPGVPAELPWTSGVSSSAPAQDTPPVPPAWSRAAARPRQPPAPPPSTSAAASGDGHLRPPRVRCSAAPSPRPTCFRPAARCRSARSATCRLTAVPITVNHQGQFPVVTLSFNLAPGASLGDAVNAVNRVKGEIGLPPSIQADFQGTAAAFQASLANEWVLVLAALVTVYIVLGVLYESYIHPVTILSTLPSAGVGALLALMICGSDFSVIALIGIVLLIGIVQKNAIMMIDFALEAERKGGMAPVDAIYQACRLRFRPI